MDNKTELLIRELAEKLGVTGEYLWKALIRQALISGIVDLLVIGLWLCAAWVMFVFVQRKTTAPSATEDNRYPNATWDGEDAGLAWLLCSIFLGTVIIFAGCTASTIVGALINPEYWALKQLLL